jgi:hypothetical protein
MLLSALIALAVPQHSGIPYHAIITTEAKSPHVQQAKLIQTKRDAFLFFYLVKDGFPKPNDIRTYNWRKSNVLVVYPGLVQKDAKVKLVGVKLSGHTIHVTIDTHRGISAETHYPIILLSIAKQAGHLDLELTDLEQVRATFRHKKHMRHASA